MKKKYKVQVYKYKEKLHYEWEAFLLEKTKDAIVLYEYPNRELIHHTRGKVFTFQTYSVEWIPLNEAFTVHVGITETGEQNFYCNICLPPEYDGGQLLTFVDLDIDLIKQADGNWTVVDEDEFAENQKLLHYPRKLVETAINAKDDLLERIQNQIYPFDGTIDHYINQLFKFIK